MDAVFDRRLSQEVERQRHEGDEGKPGAGDAAARIQLGMLAKAVSGRQSDRTYQVEGMGECAAKEG